MTRKVGSAALTLSVLWALVSLVLRGGVGVSLATAGPPSPTNFTRDFQIACLDAQHFSELRIRRPGGAGICHRH